MSEKSPRFTLRTAVEIPNRLCEIYTDANSRRLLQAMAVCEDVATIPILETLVDEKTTFLPDLYSYYFSDNAWRWSINAERRHRAQSSATALQRRIAGIENVGGSARMIHSPLNGIRRALHIAGRNHMKIYGADNTVLSFGGVNCSEASFDHHDYLIETTDARIADILFTHAQRLYELGRIPTTRTDHSASYRIDEQNEILIDYGRPNCSLIYEEAISLVRSVDQGLLFVSQHRPGGKLEREISRKLDVLGSDAVDVLFNHHTAFQGTGRAQQFIESLTPFADEMYPQSGYIHAKLIIGYFADGRRIAISGSHNFHEGGVRLGTSEIALKTSDDNLIDQLERFAGSIPVDRD